MQKPVSVTERPVNYTFQFADVFNAWPLLLQGTWITIQLSFVAMLLGLAVAIVCAWGKTAGPAPLRFVINAYIELIRNTPFLVQLFFFFFALPALGLRWSSHTATPERAKQVQFSKPYAAATIVVYGAKKTSIKAAADLKAVRVGVARASTQAIALTAAAPAGTEIRRFDDDASVMQALMAGQ